MNIDNSVKYELPVQTEIPSVISVPRAEMCSNTLLFYDVFRGLCRLRIDYAKNKASKMLISAQLRIFYPNQRRIATNYKNVTSYSVQRIVNYLEKDMGKI